MFLNVGGRRTESGMIGYQMAASFRGAMQRLETCVETEAVVGDVSTKVTKCIEAA